MSEDGMDDWAAAMAEQAESEDAEQENDDVQVAELDELTDDAPITQEEKKKLDTILDIPVTILDIIGVDKPSGMHGVSLKPIMEGKSPEPREYVVSETMFAMGDRNLGATGRMIRTKKYKYCIYDNGEKREQLFDMEKDPGETTNLYESHPEVAKRLLKQLEADVNRGRSTQGPASENDIQTIKLWKSGKSER